MAEYVAAERPLAANRLIARVREAVDLLAEQPKLGRHGRVAGTRELIVPDTRLIVVYRRLRGHLQIVAVIHMAMRWPDDF
jgi:plasmid stabilization system protein ParE